MRPRGGGGRAVGTNTLMIFITRQARSNKKMETSSTSEASTRPIRVYYDGRRFLVWNTRDAYTLRCLHRIVGSLVGALPTNKRQTQEFGMPLSLLFEEALLVAEEGIAEVVDVSELDPAPPLAVTGTPTGSPASAGDPAPPPVKPATTGWHEIHTECDAWLQQPLKHLEPHQIRLAPGARLLHAPVYRALWDRGFFITCGNGFGGDYLCYPGDPMRHHAHLLVHVARPGRPTRFVEVGCAARLANSVKKTAVLAEVGDGHEVRFSPIEQPTIRLFPFPSPEDVSRGGRGKVALDDEARVNAVPIAESSGALAEAKALVAPVEGSGVQVPAPRTKTRRSKAPWEAEEKPSDAPRPPPATTNT